MAAVVVVNGGARAIVCAHSGRIINQLMCGLLLLCVGVCMVCCVHQCMNIARMTVIQLHGAHAHAMSHARRKHCRECSDANSTRAPASVGVGVLLVNVIQ